MSPFKSEKLSQFAAARIWPKHVKCVLGLGDSLDCNKPACNSCVSQWRREPGGEISWLRHKEQISLTSYSSGSFPFQLISDCFIRDTHVFPEAAFLTANLLCEIGQTTSVQTQLLVACKAL